MIAKREKPRIEDSKKRKCDACGKVRPCWYLVSPYDEDVNGVDGGDEARARWMCKDCLEESAAAI